MIALMKFCASCTCWADYELGEEAKLRKARQRLPEDCGKASGQLIAWEVCTHQQLARATDNGLLYAYELHTYEVCIQH